MDAFSAVLQGLPMTIVLTLSAFAIGIVGAVPLAVGLSSSNIVVRLACRLFVDLVRGVPIIVWLFLLKFGIQVGTFKFNPVGAAIVGLGVVSIAYLAEIYRGGLESVPRGQNEAADALGLSRGTTFLRVLVPQAFRIVSPSIATYLTGLLKDSSIASTIIVAEMVFQSQAFARQHPTMEGILPYVLVGILYIVLSLPVAYLSRSLDARMRKAVYA
ncbi:amino acid ABC transporter permease [Arthrobacter cupressi]|uniref:Polar amino acid transport system permease protein n=1 Tax=Arthrobacter cupressi TaxID=1045773 RepID=A0A1G8QDG3_9MICC|nr:amino acid ABC transporter permease [Arthrobacter cupressi]NYD78107.1 His/Glu/Gln/Arg/opine family amino acid ABC transporter permease subunit [Arthrobacter cupressi]SDJ02802.1 polar amino acid transport system permease protein [Arthrobacter cupressi]